MKPVLVVAVIAFIALSIAIVQVHSCDPDSNGKPNCTVANAGQVSRNYWDPVHYWECPSDGGEAVSKICPINQGFSSANNTCVDWGYWRWTAPCSELK